MNNTYDPNSGKIRCRIICTIVRWIITPFVILLGDFHPERYKPKAKSFILIANHVQAFDPAYEMIALHRYLRFISSDHLEHVPVGGWALKFFGGVIYKHRGSPSKELTDKIIASVKAGIPVGLHAEGGLSKNGETGFISEHTGQLIKDSGVALITVRNIGGYLKSPRWAKNKRRGPAFTKIVAEYSAEELSGMSAAEITEIIRRDTYVNIFDEQKKAPHEYTGKALCEQLERSLYICPACSGVQTMQSSGDIFKCNKCGYSVGMDTHGFFTDNGSGLLLGNIVAWDRFQRREWQSIVESTADGQVIFEEKHQKVWQIAADASRELLSDDATLRLYPDSFWIILGGSKGSVTVPFSEIKRVMSVSKTGLIIISDKQYLYLGADYPRCAEKYVAAWRWKTGREYL